MRSTSGGFVAGLGSHDIAPAAHCEVGPEGHARTRGSRSFIRKSGGGPGHYRARGGSDVANLKTRAVKEEGGYRVSGSKTFITSGHRADYYTVAVRTGEPGHGGISMLLIERNRPGFTRGRMLKKTGWWASDTAELFFDDVQVPAENLIGQENGGFMVIMTNFLQERLMLCTMGAMTAQLALEQAMTYSQPGARGFRSLDQWLSGDPAQAGGYGDPGGAGHPVYLPLCGADGRG